MLSPIHQDPCVDQFIILRGAGGKRCRPVSTGVGRPGAAAGRPGAAAGRPSAAADKPIAAVRGYRCIRHLPRGFRDRLVRFPGIIGNFWNMRPGCVLCRRKGMSASIAELTATRPLIAWKWSLNVRHGILPRGLCSRVRTRRNAAGRGRPPGCKLQGEHPHGEQQEQGPALFTAASRTCRYTQVACGD